jgi:hypothetical protein
MGGLTELDSCHLESLRLETRDDGANKAALNPVGLSRRVSTMRAVCRMSPWGEEVVNPVLVRKSAKPTNRGFTTSALHGDAVLTNGDEGLLVGRHCCGCG